MELLQINSLEDNKDFPKIQVRISEVILKYCNNEEMNQLRDICKRIAERYKKALASDANTDKSKYPTT